MVGDLSFRVPGMLKARIERACVDRGIVRCPSSAFFTMEGYGAS
jgi:hypothetical protein